VIDPPALTRFEKRVTSQNGEDGVIAEILRRIGGPRDRWFVEFGAGSGDEANCVQLADAHEWSGLFIESSSGDYRALADKYGASERVRTRRATVTPDNIERLFREAEVPSEVDVLSIDIDGNDYWVWEAIRSITPRLVVVEYNANLPLDRPLVMPRDDEHEWDGTDYVGASLTAYRALGLEKGYELVHTDTTGVNAFFVHAEEVKDLPRGDQVPLHRANYFGAGITLPRDPQDRPFFDPLTGELTSRGD
jgi:hypothetical protein